MNAPFSRRRQLQVPPAAAAVRFLLLHALVGIATFSVEYQGLPLPIWRFIGTLEGFLIGVGIFFGTLLPLALTVMVQRTLAAKSTQSATGLLYVVVIAAIIGDFSYRFYQLRYQVFL